MRWAAAGVGLALLEIGLRRFHFGEGVFRVVALFLLCGLVIALYRVRLAVSTPKRFAPQDLILALLLFLVALLPRCYGISGFPFGLFQDEEQMARAAMEIRSPVDLLPWKTIPMRAGWVEIPVLYYGFPALLFRLFGLSFFSIKLVSLIPGALTVPLLFAFLRRMAGRIEALAGGLLLTFCPWQVVVARWGWIEVASTFGLLAASLLIVARRPLAAGCLLALDLYLYEALRVPVAAGICLLLLAPKISLRKKAAAMVLLVVLILPLAVNYAHNPGNLLTRAREVSLLREAKPARALLSNLLDYALMFHATSDPNPRLNPPGEPFLDPFAAAFFLVGLAFILRRRDWAACVVLTGLAAAIVPGVLTLSRDAPHGFRTGAAAPFAVGIAGLGFGALYRKGRIVALLLLVLSLVHGVVMVERSWPLLLGPEPPLSQGAQLEAVRIANRLTQQGVPVRCSASLRGATWDLLAQRPVEGNASVLIEDPERASDLSCAQGSLRAWDFQSTDLREVKSLPVIESPELLAAGGSQHEVPYFKRDRFDRPILLVASGCRERPAVFPIEVSVWHRAKRTGVPSEIRQSAHFTEESCEGVPCAATFRATLRLPSSGRYGFETYSDDGSALLVDGRSVVRNRGESLGRRRSGEIELAAGRHRLRVDYLFVRGKRRLRVLVRPPDASWQPIPWAWLERPR